MIPQEDSEVLVLCEDDGISITDFLKGIHLLKACDLIASSWNAVKARTLRLSRRKIILEDKSTCTNTEELNGNPTISDFDNMFRMFGHNITNSEISEWLQSDERENGFANLPKMK